MSKVRQGKDAEAEVDRRFSQRAASAIGTGSQQGALGLGPHYLAAHSGCRYTAMIFPKQLFVRFDGLGGNKGHTLQAGRFEFRDGSEVAPKNARYA